jgi:hypothetical protein
MLSIVTDASLAPVFGRSESQLKLSLDKCLV